METLERENRFLRRKLRRSEIFRELLEEHKDRTAVVLKKINGELNAARLAIKKKTRLWRRPWPLPRKSRSTCCRTGIPRLPVEVSTAVKPGAIIMIF